MLTYFGIDHVYWYNGITSRRINSGNYRVDQKRHLAISCCRTETVARGELGVLYIGAYGNIEVVGRKHGWICLEYLFVSFWFRAIKKEKKKNSVSDYAFGNNSYPSRFCDSQYHLAI